MVSRNPTFGAPSTTCQREYLKMDSTVQVPRVVKGNRFLRVVPWHVTRLGQSTETFHDRSIINMYCGFRKKGHRRWKLLLGASWLDAIFHISHISNGTGVCARQETNQYSLVLIPWWSIPSIHGFLKNPSFDWLRMHELETSAPCHVVSLSHFHPLGLIFPLVLLG